MSHPWPSESSGHPYRWRHPVDPPYYTDAPKSTGATAGLPGVFTGGSGGVNTLVEMPGVTASPATAWSSAQRVVCNDGTECFWNGTAWTQGRAP